MAAGRRMRWLEWLLGRSDAPEVSHEAAKLPPPDRTGFARACAAAEADDPAVNWWS